MQYRLRFLKTEYYKGTISPAALREASKFTDTTGIKCDPDNFYICAPASQFELQKRPVDPILFYKLGTNEFYAVAKWGNDLSIFRKLMVYPLRNALTGTVISAVISIGGNCGKYCGYMQN